MEPQYKIALVGGGRVCRRGEGPQNKWVLASRTRRRATENSSGWAKQSQLCEFAKFYRFAVKAIQIA